MPATEHLTRLGYLFEVLADPNSPEKLTKEIKGYLYSDPGMTRVMEALVPVEHGDAKFDALSEKARPIAQAARIVRVVRAFAEELPHSTARQQLALVRIAQADLLHRQGYAKEATVKSLTSEEPLLTSSLTHTIQTSLTKFVTQPPQPSDALSDRRSDPISLRPEGRQFIHRLLGRMRMTDKPVTHEGSEEVIEGITNQLRD